MKQGKVDLEKQRREFERMKAELAAKPPQERKTTVRAVAQILQDVHVEARVGRFRIESDEPLARGGTEAAPTPLQYLMAATAF